jgi:hypothetical protein
MPGMVKIGGDSQRLWLEPLSGDASQRQQRAKNPTHCTLLAEHRVGGIGSVLEFLGCIGQQAAAIARMRALPAEGVQIRHMGVKSVLRSA